MSKIQFKILPIQNSPNAKLKKNVTNFKERNNRGQPWDDPNAVIIQQYL